MKMTRKSNLFMGATLVALMIGLGVAGGMLERSAVAEGQAGVQAPMFEVDPFWPKPLPNHWIMGSTIGVSVDSRDHVWVIHRQTTFAARTRSEPHSTLRSANAASLHRTSPSSIRRVTW